LGKIKKRPTKRTALNGTNYTGSLAEPISLKRYVSHVGLLPTEEEFAANERDYENRLFKAREEKLGALFKLFSIKPDAEFAWSILAWSLACAHVPGFQLAKGPGAPRRAKSDWEICSLIFDYLQENPSKTISDACRTLTRSSGPLKGLTGTTVRRIYAAGSPCRKILEKARLWEETQRLRGQAAESSEVRSENSKKVARK
jgi:hypothetical protein